MERWNTFRGKFVDFLNRFILSKSSQHSWQYTDTDKHLKGLYGIGVLISDNSLSSEIVSDTSNLGSVSSNWNSCHVKDHDKNSSDPRLVLENLKLKGMLRRNIEHFLKKRIYEKWGFSETN